MNTFWCLLVCVCVDICVSCAVVDSSGMGKKQKETVTNYDYRSDLFFFCTHSTKPGQVSRMTGLSKFSQMYKILGIQ